VSVDRLKTLLRNILDTDLIIIGHNLKYDLQIIEEFLRKDSKAQEKNTLQDL